MHPAEPSRPAGHGPWSEDRWHSPYANQRVLVLGAAGFIGRWVARSLSRRGALVHLVVRNESHAKAALAPYGIDGSIAEANLLEPKSVEDVFEWARPSITFNLIVYGVDPSERDEDVAQRTNVELVSALCAQVAAHRSAGWVGQDIVHVGSAAEYGIMEGRLDEEAVPRPTTTYGRTKLAGTQALATGCRDHGLRGLTARLFVVYGPGEHRERLLPSLMEAAGTGRRLALTEGYQRRDFAYVEDVAEGLLRLGLTSTPSGTVVHLATGQLWSVRAFASVAAAELGMREESLAFGALPTRPDEMQVTAVDTQRLRALVGWEPPTGIAVGIRRTVAFQGRSRPWTGIPMREERGAAQSPPAAATPHLSLVISCYNEAEVVRNTALRLVEEFRARHVDLELVLVDNGSTDDTGRIIDALITEGLPVVKVSVVTKRGYGDGVLQGLPQCRGSWVGFTYADGQVEAVDVFRAYEIAAHTWPVKLVKVRRRFRMDGFPRKIVSVLYNVAANALFGGLGSIDLNGNPKILPREYVEGMQLESSDWFLDAEVLIQAKRLRLPVIEFNVMAQMREGGLSNVRVATCWEFVVNLLRYRFRSPRVESDGSTRWW